MKVPIADLQKTAQIKNWILETTKNYGIDASELATKFNMSLNGARYHLDKLRENGTLKTTHYGRLLLYYQEK